MENYSNLKGKTCILTGGGGVLGKVIAGSLAAQGIHVAILDRDEQLAIDAANFITAETGTRCIGVLANVLEKDSLQKAKAVVLKEFGDYNILINGAGGNAPTATTKVEQVLDPSNLEGSFFGLDLAGFQKVLDLNFLGTVLPSMVLADYLVQKKEGVILNISSMNSFRPLTKIPAYSAAKSSVNNFTQWLAVHLGQTGVRVNAIAPGFFLTNQNRFLLTDEKTGELTPRGNKIIANTPMARFGEPEDLTGTVLYLLSDASKFVTGIIIPVDGGYSAFGGV
jgi:NAD(P)-dependent dehydrogenase (short-subunit alcohol dehydrogenase family)